MHSLSANEHHTLANYLQDLYTEGEAKEKKALDGWGEDDPLVAARAQIFKVSGCCCFGTPQTSETNVAILIAFREGRLRIFPRHGPGYGRSLCQREGNNDGCFVVHKTSSAWWLQRCVSCTRATGTVFGIEGRNTTVNRNWKQC